MPQKDDRVSYRALGTGDIYSAKVMRVSPDGKLVDIDIDLPAVKGPFSRTRVPWFDEETAQRGAAMPERIAT